MRVTNPMFALKAQGPGASRGAGKPADRARRHANLRPRTVLAAWLLTAWLPAQFASGVDAHAQNAIAGARAESTTPSAHLTPRAQPLRTPAALPPRVVEAQRFLAARGWAAGHRGIPRANAVRPLSTKLAGASADPATAQAQPALNATSSASSATWQPLGPAAVLTTDFGLVSSRVSALALDDAGALYIGTTGGGVWMANNPGASSPTPVVFTPLTDDLTALGGAQDASISIGALTAQPGGTGVILAGTGDPNDALDSYYGAGILRSADGGNTWSLIEETADLEDGLSATNFSFIGLGFAGFAWSTANPQLVVAAVSQAYEGTVVGAELPDTSYAGLYYSSDSGATWHIATMTDGSGEEVQGPNLVTLAPYGNAATAVVWNPVRQLFVAAVRYHGYYQSADGMTWTRLSVQPGANLTATLCPADQSSLGSIACPIFRGALAVNPTTGDTFAWSVDLNDQDQGIWQDLCALSSGSCGNSTITFGNQLNTAALETGTLQGAATIADGTYNLALAAIPSEQETQVLAGANDLWETTCAPLGVCIAWRNTTNSTTCMSAAVGEFQHALAWSATDPLEIFIGNDSGLWRSMDGIAESGAVCNSSDASHFQNLNGDFYDEYASAAENTPGSLAEVVSLSPVVTSPYNMMAGVGVNGTAGVKSSTTTADWPQILSGYGGPVAIDPRNSSNWYVNSQPGVAIYLCSQNTACTPAAFGTAPVVNDADIGGDGYDMPTPAPFLVDPLDSTQLLVGTCRVWRGPADGAGWSSSNAISPILDSGAMGVSCNGDALIRSMAAMPLATGGEIIYLGMYGSADNGANLPGHVLSAILNPSSGVAPTWTDLTLNPVVNDANALNYYGLDISSVTIDTHDTSGNTVYVTVEGMKTPEQAIQTVYRSTNGGATWTDMTANLPAAPANSLAIDPQSANTVYVATDLGVYFTPEAANCGQSLSNCWSVFGTGLPGAPAVALSAAPAAATDAVLVAATYGRGIWQSPLWSSGTALSAASVNPVSLVFPSQAAGSSSSVLTVTVLNTGSIALTPTSIAMSGNFTESDTCVNAAVAAGASCSIQVTFEPQTTGALSGEMTLYANVYGGQLTVDLNGTGTAASGVSVNPASLSFAQEEVGEASAPLAVTISNSSAAPVLITGISVTAPFSISSNACGTTSLAASSACQMEVEFTPTQTGAASGQLILSSAAGTQTVQLNGTGEPPPTDTLNATSLTFPATGEGQISQAQSVTMTNSGGVPLTSISITASAQYQESSNCGTQLAAGSVCTINMEFAPTQTGTIPGTLTISDALRTQTIALGGTGVLPVAFSVTPSSLSFTNQQPGVASSPQTLVISNSGGAPIANVGLQFTGSAASDYSVASTTCGALLNNGASCAAQIVFTPSATGAIAATLVISSSTSGVTAASVALNGSGQLSTGLATNPAQITFPVVGAGQSSVAQPVIITNSSSYAIGSVSLAAPAPFSVTQNTCTGSLAAGANCTASVVFEPSASGSASGALMVSSLSVATPATVALAGTGFDFTAVVSGSASQSAAAGQQATFTLVITPSGSSGTFSFNCGTLPANALCTFNPPTETLGVGVVGNVAVEISTTGSTARLERRNIERTTSDRPDRETATSGRPEGWPALPLACGIFLLPLALVKHHKALVLIFLALLLTCGVSSCTSSGGGTGGSFSGQSGSTGTPVGTYTIPVSVASTGVTQTVNLTLTVD